MKANNIILLLIASFVMSACASADSAGKGLNDYQYSAGSYYSIQTAQKEFSNSEKNDKTINFTENPIRIYLDLALFFVNIFYFPITGETLLGSFTVPEKEFDRKIRSLQMHPDIPLDPSSEDNSESIGIVGAFGDFLLFPFLNIPYYFITEDTLFGSVGKMRRMGGKSNIEGYNKTAMARSLLLTSAERSHIDSFQSVKRYYFTSDKIMDYYDAETFGQLLADANWILDDLDLSSEDAEELKQNGYLDFLEDDSKSVSTFEAAPTSTKGKKK
ncbi:hypothetical protein Lepto782_13665 [Leptospira interrogans serovar Canicola]|uniref:Lipoprotein n=1 Tax=Leptospira interrogans serovar Canicola TaxID=211880 RepID=A0AAP9WDK2_LEPIR|nr:hypothetical protein [Leptospira interrogans]QOI43205.1 hypothetical protein Lepto782_13665 [Leptospira interrogans serovar Canicola]